MGLYYDCFTDDDPEAQKDLTQLTVWEMKSTDKIWTQGWGLFFKAVLRVCDVTLVHTNLEKMVLLEINQQTVFLWLLPVCYGVSNGVTSRNKETLSYHIETTIFLFNFGC